MKDFLQETWHNRLYPCAHGNGQKKYVFLSRPRTTGMFGLTALQLFHSLIYWLPQPFKLMYYKEIVENSRLFNVCSTRCSLQERVLRSFFFAINVDGLYLYKMIDVRFYLLATVCRKHCVGIEITLWGKICVS